MNERTTREAVRIRSGEICEICHRQRATNMHHRKRAGRVWTPSNVLHLCGSGTSGCHGMVTDTNGRAAEFKANGWIVPSWEDPFETPVRMWNGMYYLDDEGGMTRVGSR